MIVGDSAFRRAEDGLAALRASEARQIDPLRAAVWGGLVCFVVLAWTAIIASLV